MPSPPETARRAAFDRIADPPPAAVELDDAALLARIAERDRAAFDTFYRRHYVRLLRFVQRVALQPDVVDEVVNDTMLTVWRGAGEFRAEARVTTWLMGIAWRRAKSRLRDADRHPPTTDIEALALPDPACLESWAANRQLGRHLRAALATLSPAHRAVVELTYVHGYSSREVGAILGCPEGTVRTRMLHARARLRAVLSAARHEVSERGHDPTG